VTRLSQSLDFDLDPTGRRRTIAAFQALLFLIVGVEYWCRALPKWGSLSLLYLSALPVATILCTIGFGAVVLPRRQGSGDRTKPVGSGYGKHAGRALRAAALGLAVVHAIVIAAEFPAAGNHAYLELYFCLLVAFVDPECDEEQRMFVMAARWMMVVIFFYSGLQKLVHGYYFAAQYFAFSMALDTFRDFFRWFASAEEVQRLAALGGGWGDGPYRSDDAALRWLANATWLLEIALAPLLLMGATRALAVVGILALVMAIEAAAREVFFGLIFANGLLLFVPPRIHERLLPAGILLLAALLLVRFGVLPEVTFY